ncbi:MAG: ATP-binding protein [Phycisphaerae bacterium]|jgi:signal transduction histidine kinase
MTLRTRLILLLGTFAAFAVVVAAATIYAVQWQVEHAVRDFEQAIDQTADAGQLHALLSEQSLHLRDMVGGCQEATRPYFTKRDEFGTRLRQLASFAPEAPEGGQWRSLLATVESFERESDNCLALVEAGEQQKAQELFASRLEGALLPKLKSRLHVVETTLGAARDIATREVVGASTRVLILTVMVAVFGAALVVIGVVLIRRWLLTPIEDLHAAAERFGKGEFEFRTSPRRADELGQLGLSLNAMAESVSLAQAQTRASEEKHRTLFANLRDAVVICDVDCNIIEYHDGETGLLGVAAGEHQGRQLLEVWSEWQRCVVDWKGVVRAAVKDGKRYRAVDVELAPSTTVEAGPFADVQVYRVEFGERRYAALVLRDVTEQHRLQIRIRRAHTMEAVGTMAGGLAHDFNNLLTQIMGVLNALLSDAADGRHEGRIRSALRACRHAAGLSKRLLSFAGSAHGHKQRLCLADTVKLIVESLDPSFFEGVKVEKQLDAGVHARMDPDQFTQVALNLLRNARDAMPDGGHLKVSVEPVLAKDVDEPADERPYALLTVQDTGAGMSPDVQRRIFEPFYTTKSRVDRRGRGMGMAIVYAAVNNAGGFLRVHSQPEQGTTVCVYLPMINGHGGGIARDAGAVDVKSAGV